MRGIRFRCNFNGRPSGPFFDNPSKITSAPSGEARIKKYGRTWQPAPCFGCVATTKASAMSGFDEVTSDSLSARLFFVLGRRRDRR